MIHTGPIQALKQFGDKVTGESFENAEIFAAGVILFDSCHFKECIIHDDPVITYMRCWLDNVRANTFAYSRAGNLCPINGSTIIEECNFGPTDRVCSNSTCRKTTDIDKPCWWCGEK